MNIILFCFLLTFALPSLSADFDFKKIQVPKMAGGIAYDGEALWISDTIARRLIRIDTKNKTTAFKLNVPFLSDLYFDSNNGRILLASKGQLLEIFPFNGTIISRIKIDIEKIDGITADKNVIFLLKGEDGVIQFLDKKTGSLIGGIQVPSQNISGLHFTDNFLWSCEVLEGNIIKIDPLDGKIIAKYPSGYRNIKGITFTENLILFLNTSDYTIGSINRNNATKSSVTQK